MPWYALIEWGRLLYETLFAAWYQRIRIYFFSNIIFALVLRTSYSEVNAAMVIT